MTRIVIRENGQDIEASGFNIELVPKLFQDHQRTQSPPEAGLKTASNSQENTRPILNLICTVRSMWAAAAIYEIKHRLRPESTIFVLADGFNVLEEIWALNFPDPNSRPSFRFCLGKHDLWESQPGADKNGLNDGLPKPVDAFIQGRRFKAVGYDVYHRIREGHRSAKLRIGPLALDKNTTSKKDRLYRMHNMQYLTTQVLECPRLNGEEVDNEILLYYRYKTLVKDAVLG